jgi:teichuronic acid biosynthesis glycosyltransferase TuaG
MGKLVSVLIVAHNADTFIDKTIRSCLEQSYQNIELLILDNNSLDNTLDVITSFNDPRIHLYRNDQNFSPYAGLNYLIERAAGDYIAIQDHDDIWFPEKIEKQVKFLNDNQDFIACGTNTYFFYESRHILILIENPAIADIVSHTSLVFRGRDFRYHIDYVLADEHFMRRVLPRFGKIACLQKPLCVHRMRADAKNLSSYRFSLSRKNMKDFFTINGLTTQSAAYFLFLLTRDIFPESLVWNIRKNITLRKKEWISLSAFEERYPNVLL